MGMEAQLPGPGVSALEVSYGTLACVQCHQGNLDGNSDSLLDELGNRLKGPKEQVCDPCHDGSKKLPGTWERMNNHVDKGSTGIGGCFCHEFRRPERNLYDPCVESCSGGYVDKQPCPHQRN